MGDRGLDLFFDMNQIKNIPRQNNLEWDKVVDGRRRMEGTIARIISAKKFGFIHGADKKDYFFHCTDLNGFFDDLVADYENNRVIKVEFESVPSQKGLRAGNVTRIDGGI